MVCFSRRNCWVKPRKMRSERRIARMRDKVIKYRIKWESMKD